MTFRLACLLACAAFLFPQAVFADTQVLTPDAYVAPSLPVHVTWVAPNGSDTTGDGSEAHPFLTPGHAAQFGRTIVLKAGRYSQFGRITQGGTARDPLVIRPAQSSDRVIFALQDAQQPAEIAASHVRLEGISITGEELVTPGDCLRLATDIQDLELAYLRFDHCQTAINGNRRRWEYGTISHTTIRDSLSALQCTGACLTQHWNRLRVEQIGDGNASSSALFLSASSTNLRVRDLNLRDVEGDGLRVEGGRPSIANSFFTQISGTAIFLAEGGFVGKTEIATRGRGLIAHVGPDLVVERSLLYKLTPEATPFAIDERDTSSPSSTLLIAFTRIEAATSSLRLAGTNSRHRVSWTGDVFWFSNEREPVFLPNKRTVAAETLIDDETIDQDEDSLFFFTPPAPGDLFTPIFSGGTVTRNDNDSRTITAGMQIRGNEEEPPYVLGQNNRVHLLEGLGRTLRWYPYPVEVTVIGNSAFSNLLRGGDMTEPPGTLVKAKTRPQVYLVTAPNHLRWLANETIAAAYAGPRWTRSIVTLPNSEMTKYSEDVPILSTHAFAEADVLRQVPDPADLFEDR